MALSAFLNASSLDMSARFRVSVTPGSGKAGSWEGTKVLKFKGTESCSDMDIVYPSCFSCMNESGSKLEPAPVPEDEGGTLYHLHLVEQCAV